MQPHPWNTNFTWRPSRATSGILTTDQVEHYDTHGYVVLDQVLDLDMLANLTKRLDEQADETARALRTLPDQRFTIAEADAIVFGVHPVLYYQAARDLASSPLFTGICEDLVGERPRLYWDQLVYKYPDKPRRFPWHQDNGYGYMEPQQYLTCWIPLNDATEDNGCPWIAPGVHRQGTLEHTNIEGLGHECFTDHPDAFCAPVKAGSVLVFSSLTPHLTGPNTTDHVRKAYILQYAPDGAEVLRGEPGGPVEREDARDPDRQFPIGW